MRMYWGARRTMYLLLPSIWAPRQGNELDLPQKDARGRCWETARKNDVVVASVETKNEQRLQVGGYLETTRRVRSPLSPRIGYCRVCLGSNRILKRCPLKVDAYKLAAVREASRKFRPSLSQRTASGLRWTKRRQGGTCWSIQ